MFIILSLILLYVLYLSQTEFPNLLVMISLVSIIAGPNEAKFNIIQHQKKKIV